MASNEMIGHDPLAWIKEDASSEAAPEPVVSTEPEAVEEQVSAVEMAAEAPAAEAEAVAPTTERPVEPAVMAAASQDGILSLGEQLVISNASKTRAEWLDQIANGIESPLTLDGGEVQSIDTAGLQLIMALIRQLNEDGISWQWGGKSDTLQRSANELQLTQAMSL